MLIETLRETGTKRAGETQRSREVAHQGEGEGERETEIREAGAVRERLENWERGGNEWGGKEGWDGPGTLLRASLSRDSA